MSFNEEIDVLPPDLVSWVDWTRDQVAAWLTLFLNPRSVGALMKYENITGMTLCFFDVLEPRRLSRTQHAVFKEKLAHLTRPENQPIIIQLKDYHGVAHFINMPPTSKVQDIKRVVEFRKLASYSQSRLIHAGRQLSDEKLLSSYEIKPEDVVHLVLALRGS